MKFFIAVVALAALAAAKPQEHGTRLRQFADVKTDYPGVEKRISNAFAAIEEGQLKAAQNEEVQSQYTYTAAEGNQFKVKYPRDGFQP